MARKLLFQPDTRHGQDIAHRRFGQGKARRADRMRRMDARGTGKRGGGLFGPRVGQGRNGRRCLFHARLINAAFAGEHSGNAAQQRGKEKQQFQDRSLNTDITPEQWPECPCPGADISTRAPFVQPQATKTGPRAISDHGLPLRLGARTGIMSLSLSNMRVNVICPVASRAPSAPSGGAKRQGGNPPPQVPSGTSLLGNTAI